MQQTTTEFLILYIYKELNSSQTTEIEKLISENSTVKAEYEELLQSLQFLDTGFKNPHPSSVQIISEYSHDSFSETV